MVRHSEWVPEHIDRWAGLDLVVANANLEIFGDIGSADPERWTQMVETNLLGPALLIRAAADALLQSRGHIVLVGSVAGGTNEPDSLYSATKAGLASLAENTRAQLGLNRWSQHLDLGGADGKTAWVVGDSDGATWNEVAGEAAVAARCRACVLG